MMIALPVSAPPTTSRARAVVTVNSSMFCRVPGPAEALEIVLTISAYLTGVTRLIAATIGTVAWPPQVIRLTLPAPACSRRLTGGTTKGPTAAGVRSTASLPASRSCSAWRRWAPALVASKTMRISGSASTGAMPSAVVSIPSPRARARPSEAGSTPASSATSIPPGSRSSL